jgi:hypothetical protein
VNLDAKTIHAAAWTWWLHQLGDRYQPGAIHPETAQMQLYIYRIGSSGRWHIRNGRLYWDDDPTDDHWNSCDPHDLADTESELGVVILADRILRDERYWPTFTAFAADIGLA